MEKEILQICQAKINRAYQEQIWAVVIVATLNGFIFKNVIDLVKIKGLVIASIILIAILSTIFIFIKHKTYKYYDKIIVDLVKLPESDMKPRWLNKWGHKIALFMGVTIYSIIVLCSSAATIYFLIKKVV
jgi:hypothetical protein